MVLRNHLLSLGAQTRGLFPVHEEEGQPLHGGYLPRQGYLERPPGEQMADFALVCLHFSMNSSQVSPLCKSDYQKQLRIQC